MKLSVPALAVSCFLLALGCSSHDAETHSRAEHDRDGGEHGSEEGEESGTELSLDEAYDQVRNGARLVIAYDADVKAFIGTVENTTERTLERVRVEVHLSNGKELGPTTPGDLEPGAKRNVKLIPTTMGFDSWTTHAEVGNEEHGGEGEHGHEGRGEHDREGGGEHGREGRGEHK